MIIQVDVISQFLDDPVLLLPILDSSDSPFQITNIDGLGPVKANVETSLYGGFPGEAVLGSSVGKRNIVITFGLNPDWATQTVDELRYQLYNYFMPQQSVILDFHSQRLPLCRQSGVVESLEPNMFAKDPTVDVSIICGHPEFMSTSLSQLTGIIAPPTIDLPPTATLVCDINYSGTLPTGLNLVLSNDGSTYTGPMTLSVSGPGGEYGFHFDSITIPTTHNFELRSIPGEKHVRYLYLPDAGGMNIIGEADEDYSWPLLWRGDNTVQVSVASDGRSLNYELSYTEIFGGL